MTHRKRPPRTPVEEIAALRRLKEDQLAERYTEVFGRAPKIRTRSWLEKRIAWKVQAQGAATGESQTAVPHRPRKPGEPAVGTTIVRRWHGKDLHIHVVDGGYEYDDVVYRSLSAAALAVTGAHWNGRLFWGVVQREAKA